MALIVYWVDIFYSNHNNYVHVIINPDKETAQKNAFAFGILLTGVPTTTHSGTDHLGDV